MPNSFTYEDGCFTLYFEPVTWFVAHMNCIKIHSKLATMKTKQAINDISLKIKEYHRDTIYYWVGLRKSYWFIPDKTGREI